MFKLLRFLKGYVLKTVFGPLLKLIEAIFELFTPIVVAWVIDKAIPMAKGGDYSGLIIGGAIILGLAVIGLASALTAQFFASRASLGFGTNLRSGLYEHVNKFSYSDLDGFSSASLITRLTSDVNQTQQAIAMFIRLVLRAPFIVVGAIIMALLINVKLSLIFIIVSLFIAITLFIIMKSTLPAYKNVQSELDEVTLLASENLSGARVVRAFGAEEREITRFSKASENLSNASIKVGSVSALLNPITYALLNLGVIALLYFGGKTVYYGQLSQGKIIALINYMTQILNAMIVFANLFVTFTKASASAARINEVFAVEPSMTDGLGATPDYSAPAVTINNASFSYSKKASPAINKVNLTIKKGQTVGVLGGTGSGKTTLINLITRMYDTTEGTINVFGNPVQNYSFAQLREIFGIAPQKSTLFKETLRENVLFGSPEASDEQIRKALAIAQAKEFTDAYSDGLDHPVEQGGKNLSGGQRQRLSIARAIIGSPKILILDDSSSALDFATDAKLRKAISTLVNENGLTSLTISQRASSVAYCDLIVVLDDGEIVGTGTHDQLMNTCEVYKEIYNSQNKEGDSNE